MCMYYCWLCCGFWSIAALKDLDHRNFAIKFFWFAVWGGFNFVWFTLWADYDEVSMMFDVSSYMHLPFITKVAMFIIGLSNLYDLETVSLYQNRTHDENFLNKNLAFMFFNLFLYSVYDGGVNAVINVLPLIFQGLYARHRPFNRENFVVLCFAWAFGLACETFGWHSIWVWVYYILSIVGVYFIEYPVVIGCAGLVAYQMDKILNNIEDYKNKIHSRGKSKKELLVLGAKEIVNYALLGFSLCFVSYCEEVIDWYHGYQPVMIMLIANLAYSFPVVVLLRPSREINEFNLPRAKIDLLNLASVLFTNYTVRLLFLS